MATRFQIDAELAKKFHDQGASDDLIEALQKAGNKAKSAYHMHRGKRWKVRI